MCLCVCVHVHMCNIVPRFCSMQKHSCILQVIKNWSQERPENKASYVCVCLGTCILVCVCVEKENFVLPSVDTGADGDALLPQTVSRG